MFDDSKEERMDFLKKKIPLMEWDLNRIEHEELRQTRESQLTRMRAELKKLLEEKILSSSLEENEQEIEEE